ncbi:hypothetical protein LTR84_007482 [Exophiala bonariae]|uniref:Uncharacterized protein n=1 Tax=Exophiala bonariae TaxID=1690606 RepID=A0AAV9N0K1_9EURO|nr:hypothetical protein LTR84_007482 [Exophiala bonariae]
MAEKAIEIDHPCTSNSTNICSQKACPYRPSYFNHTTFSCACKESPDVLITHPCINTVCGENQEVIFSILDDACLCSTVGDWLDNLSPVDSEATKQDHQPWLPQHHRRDQALESSQVNLDEPDPPYLPPPKPDITPDLIEESLRLQPQNTATVSSVIPYFKDGIIKVFIGLNGPVPQTIVVNASVNLVCGTIGLIDPQPNVALVPLVVYEGQGANETVVADCQIIAVNLYSPEVITFWVQKNADGTLYSVVSSNKVLDIDKMNPSLSTSLVLVTLPHVQKRSVSVMTNLVAPEKRQIFATDCGLACPFYHMHMIQGNDGYCGCMFNSADEEVELYARELIEPNVHTAVMSAEACAAMKCFTAGNKPAAYNQFTGKCWCYTQPLIETNPSAWSG